MMMKKLFFIVASIVMITSGCSHKTYRFAEKKDTSVVAGYSNSYLEKNVEDVAPDVKLVRPMGMVLKATAFRMNGDYSNNVAITLNDAGNVTYFPAPTDITENSRPESLGDGWWLNRQGISENSVFTRYTFEEYASLPKVPSVEELKASIIPGSRVTEIVRLPYDASEAQEKLPEIKQYLKNL